MKTHGGEALNFDQSTAGNSLTKKGAGESSLKLEQPSQAGSLKRQKSMQRPQGPEK